jgi:hypothetical protein
VFSYGENPAEVSYFGADLESATTARYWHAHLGSNEGGFYWIWCTAQTIPGDREWSLVGKPEWHHGEIHYNGAIDFVRDAPRWGKVSPPQDGDLMSPEWRRLGFRAFKFSYYGHGGYALVVPDWLLLILTAVAPALWLRRRVRMKRYRIEGRCPACGYNLTTNTSGVCPECGTAVPGATGQKPRA